jgi:hypothetical protein
MQRTGRWRNQLSRKLRIETTQEFCVLALHILMARFDAAPWTLQVKVTHEDLGAFVDVLTPHGWR